MISHCVQLLQPFPALCFTEFSLRLPRAGSAYFYSYATIGEFCGFIVGWTMILEHSIGVAIATKVWSQYLGHLTNNSLPRSTSSINQLSSLFNHLHTVFSIHLLLVGSPVSHFISSHLFSNYSQLKFMTLSFTHYNLFFLLLNGAMRSISSSICTQICIVLDEHVDILI